MEEVSIKETAVQYIIDELLTDDPDYISLVEWLEDNGLGETSEEGIWDTDIYEEVVVQLEVLRGLAQDIL